jgi:hypothetical protein
MFCLLRENLEAALFPQDSPIFFEGSGENEDTLFRTRGV